MHIAALVMQRDAESERAAATRAQRATLSQDSEVTLVHSPASLASPKSKWPPLSKVAEVEEYEHAPPSGPPALPPPLRVPSPTPTARSTSTHPGPFPDLHLATIPTRLEEEACGPPPDGGRDAWAAVLSGALLFFTTFGFVTSTGQLQGHYLAHQLSGHTAPEVAWIATLQSTLSFFPSLLFGRVFDAHGPRVLVVCGTSLSFGALVGVAFCQEYYQFLLAHAVFGFATSVIWGPSASVCGHWFAKRRATAIGIVGCGSGIGGIVYPILLKNLLGRFRFRDTILIVAGMNGVLMLPSWLWLRSRLPPRQPAPWRALLRPWGEPAFVFLALGAGLSMLNMFTPYFDAPIMAASNHLPPAISGYSIAILQSGSFLGRATSGLLADRVGTWRTYAAMSLLTAGTLFTFWCGPMPAPAVVVGLWMYGFTSGAWITLVSAVAAAISPPDEIGTWIGVLWTAISPPILGGPVIAGVLVEKDHGKFTYAGAFCGATYLVGTGVTAIPWLVRMGRGMGRRGARGGREAARDAEKSQLDMAHDEGRMGDLSG